MIFLGIDPALNQTGYAVIIQKSNQTINFLESGIIKNKSEEVFPKKILNIFEKIDEICKQYSPNICGIEETFVNVNPNSSLKLGSARGAAIVAIARNNINIVEMSPNHIKKTVTGAGKAQKHQIEFMIQKLIYGVPKNLSPDEYDALAIAFSIVGYKF